MAGAAVAAHAGVNALEASGVIRLAPHEWMAVVSRGEVVHARTISAPDV